MARKPALAAWLVAIAGALILLSSAAHGFLGWKAVREAIAPRLGPEELQDLALGWTYGSASMAAFGVLTLVSAARIRRGHAGTRFVPAVVGAAYVLYGVASTVYSAGNAHFPVAFVLPGVLLLAGAFLAPKGAA